MEGRLVGSCPVVEDSSPGICRSTTATTIAGTKNQSHQTNQLYQARQTQKSFVTEDSQVGQLQGSNAILNESMMAKAATMAMKAETKIPDKAKVKIIHDNDEYQVNDMDTMEADSPFDAVLAAAICTSGSTNKRKNSDHGSVGSNNSSNNSGGNSSSAVIPISVPPIVGSRNNATLSLPVRKRVTKAAASNTTTGGIHKSSPLPIQPTSTFQQHSESGPHHRNNSEVTTNVNRTTDGVGTTSAATTTTTNVNNRPAPPDKGLRLFSMRVAAKVEERGVTTYNEVAEELVTEIGQEVGKFDHKNVRRRVYDALNVLMAIDVIQKDKKEIRWLGLPNELASELRQLAEAIGEAEQRVEEKRRNLGELVHRLLSLKRLVHRNGIRPTLPPTVTAAATTTTTTVSKSSIDEAPRTSGLARGETTSVSVSSASGSNSSSSDKLHLPFILINAPRDCRVHCEMVEDRSQYFFEFDSPFLINEDIELLRLMGLGKTIESRNRTHRRELEGWIDEETSWLHSWLSPEALTFLGYEESSNSHSHHHHRHRHAMPPPHINPMDDHNDDTSLMMMMMDRKVASKHNSTSIIDQGVRNKMNCTTTSALGGHHNNVNEEEWDEHQVEAFLESMPPPILSSSLMAGYSLNDFGPVPFSSPVKRRLHGRDRSVTPTATGAGTGSNSTNAPLSTCTPVLRPFRSHSRINSTQRK